MKVVARHKYAPLVALEDGSIIDTEDLEVVGHGLVASASWEHDPAMETDPRWVEIAQADQASLGVTERKVPGERTFRAPGHVRSALTDSGVDTPLAAGQGLTLSDLSGLLDQDDVDGPAVEWIVGILNKHEPNDDSDEETQLASDAVPELDWDQIESAMDSDDDDDEYADADPSDTYSLQADAGDQPADDSTDAGDAGVTPPPGDFSQIVYIAIIEEDDTQSVQDLVALVRSAEGASDAYTYGDKGWTEDPSVLSQLTSTSPPPIRQLKDWQTASVIDQIQSTSSVADQDAGGSGDETVAASAFNLLDSQVLYGPDNKQILSIVAATGVRNSHSAKEWTGNAERLRQYWEHGKGAAKIRWNTPGDWKRCYRHLSKYLGPRAAGYCQLMHHRTTGTWTGSRLNVGGNGHHKHAGLLNAKGEPVTAAATASWAADTKSDKPAAPAKTTTSTGKAQSAYDEKKHSRFPKGDPRGGQFAPGKARNSEAAKAQANPAAQKLYNDFMQESTDQNSATKKMSDAELINLSKIIYSSPTSDPDVVKGRLAVAAEMAHRGYDVKDFGASGGGINSDKGKGQNWDLPASTPADTTPKTPAAPAATGDKSATPVQVATPPARHGHYSHKSGPDENGNTTYNDGWVWNGTDKVWVAPKK